MSTSKPTPLETTIVRGDQKIKEVTVTKPNAGALRGTSVSALIQMDVNALIVVLPRVTTPTLTTADVAAMDPVDLCALGVEVAGFFLPKEAQADIPTTSKK